jgi:hypothetical protein
MSSRSIHLSIKAEQLVERSTLLIRNSNALLERCHGIRTALAVLGIRPVKHTVKRAKRLAYLNVTI